MRAAAHGDRRHEGRRDVDVHPLGVVAASRVGGAGEQLERRGEAARRAVGGHAGQGRGPADDLVAVPGHHQPVVRRDPDARAAHGVPGVGDPHAPVVEGVADLVDAHQAGGVRLLRVVDLRPDPVGHALGRQRQQRRRGDLGDAELRVASLGIEDSARPGVLAQQAALGRERHARAGRGREGADRLLLVVDQRYPRGRRQPGEGGEQGHGEGAQTERAEAEGRTHRSPFLTFHLPIGIGCRNGKSPRPAGSALVGLDRRPGRPRRPAHLPCPGTPLVCRAVPWPAPSSLSRSSSSSPSPRRGWGRRLRARRPSWWWARAPRPRPAPWPRASGPRAARSIRSPASAGWRSPPTIRRPSGACCGRTGGWTSWSRCSPGTSAPSPPRTSTRTADDPSAGPTTP